MKLGPNFVRSKAHGKARPVADANASPVLASESLNTTLWQRMLAAFMAVVLAVSVTPSAALAGDDSQVSDDAAAASLSASDEESQSVSADEADASEADSVSADIDDDEENSAAAAAEEEGSSDGASLGASAIAVTSAGDNQAVAVQSNSSVTLSSNAKVYIQDTKDKDNSYYTKSGALKQGETLWANMYDGSSSYYLSSVANPGTWTYTWLASSEKGGSASDYTEVVGNEQSLTVTDALAGKYLICKVTAGGKDYYGPASSYGSGLNSNYIPGPVLAAGQANLYRRSISSTCSSTTSTAFRWNSCRRSCSKAPRRLRWWRPSKCASPPSASRSTNSFPTSSKPIRACTARCATGLKTPSTSRAAA